MWIYVIIVIILLIILYVLILCDNVFLLNVKIKKYFYNLDFYFLKRKEIIFNMIGILNGYVRNEKELLRYIVELFDNYDSLSVEDRIKVNKELEGKMIDVLSFSQKYPEIIQNGNYVKLQNALVNNKNEISREVIQYNKLVNKYNDNLRKKKFISKLFKYKEKSSY